MNKSQNQKSTRSVRDSAQAESEREKRLLQYARAQTAAWLLKLMDEADIEDFCSEGRLLFDDDFYDVVFWLMGGRTAFIRRVKPLLETAFTELSGVRRPVKNKVRGFIRDIEDHRRLSSDLAYFSADCDEYAAMLDEVLRQILGEIAGHLRHPRIEQQIKRFFGLDDACLKILRLFWLNERFNGEARAGYFICCDIEEDKNRRLLAYMLDIEGGVKAADSAMKMLEETGLIGRNNSPFDQDEVAYSAWLQGSVKPLHELFAAEVKLQALPLERCHVDENDLKLALNLLEKPAATGRSLLLYGMPGTGKTTLAASLAARLKARLWVVCAATRPERRRLSLYTCVRMAQQQPGSIVLVDEAEHLLDTCIEDHEKSATTKAGLNALLESPGLRMIWIVNDESVINPAVRRRFSFCIFFPPLTVRERVPLWRDLARKHGVSRLLSDDDLKYLSRSYPVQVAQMEQTMRLSKEVASGTDFLPCLERLLSSGVQLANHGQRPQPEHRSAKVPFEIRLTCMKEDVESFVAQCRKADRQMRHGGGALEAGCGTVLFYGPPGTGKTALARHLADELGRELIVKQISELLNCYVGNTEKNIAACFDEAERDGAVLLLDEADSLLFPRQEAFRSWEITQVNQFLTMLDNCRTWCICTTNHRLRMDGAAMRRFSFKREFVYARPEQAEELYELLLGELAAQPLSHDQRALLRSLGEITPGDFHAVRMQYHFADAHSVSFETLLKALTEEQRGHLERGHRGIGFSV